MVVARVTAQRQHQRLACELGIDPVPDRPAEHAAAVALLELVAIDRIVEEIGEVGGQPEIVISREGVDLGRAELAVAGQRQPCRPPAEVGIDEAEPVDSAAADRAFGHLVGRLPGRMIAAEA